MTDSICLFEDKYFSNLFPIVYLRPTYDLRCGILTLKEKYDYFFPHTKISLNCRSYLADFVKQQNPTKSVNKIDGNTCLFINGRTLVDAKLQAQLKSKEDTIYYHKDRVVAAKLSGANLKSIKNFLNDYIDFSSLKYLPSKNVEVKIIDYPWDLVSHNGEQIISDFSMLSAKFKSKKIKGKIFPGVHLVNKKSIYIDEGTVIKPGVVLDAEEGPIYIGKQVKIFPQAVIEGPAFIGDKTVVKIGAKIYNNTSIGEVCKVGGEIENSILHSYANKQHEGFLGHSYLGMWTNLGADTNCSDLNNNYSNVKVQINSEEIDSGLMFVGLTMADHSKCAISTMFNTGSVVGIASVLFGIGFHKKYIPSFSFGGSDSILTNNVEKAIEVAKRVALRRKILFTDAEERLFRHLFEITKDERSRLGIT